MAVDELLSQVDHEVAYATAFCDVATPRLSLDDLTGGRAWVACEFDDRPLELSDNLLNRRSESVK